MEETRIAAGSSQVRGTIAYVEQEPFIFSGTIKDNILFGMVYDD
jgi:ABC-type multidrug transport system fused ATPase/permease subunit